MLVQRVVMPDEVTESWTVLDQNFVVVAPVDAFLAYLTSIERSPNTVRSYAFDLRDFVEYLATAGVEWTSVRLEDFGRFVAWLRLPAAARAGRVRAFPGTAPQCSASTINRKLSAVIAFYEFHARHGVPCGDLLVMIRNGGARGSAWRPFLAHLGTAVQRRKTIKLKQERRLPRSLDPGQVRDILQACDRLRDRLLFTVLITAGLRIGEALGLRHDDIDPAGRLVRVRARRNANHARVKSGEREVPVPADVIRLYTDYLVEEYGELDSDYVFVNLWSGLIGNPWRYWNVTDLIARLRERTGIGFTAHQFRHSYATELLRGSVPPEIVQKLLGHASITTTIGTYAHLELDDIRRALDDVGWMDVVWSPHTESPATTP